MNKILEDKLSIIVEDKLLIEALRAVFDERIKKEKPTYECPNIELGERYRAYLEGEKMVKQAFDDLNNYYKGNKTSPKTNRGV